MDERQEGLREGFIKPLAPNGEVTDTKDARPRAEAGLIEKHAEPQAEAPQPSAPEPPASGELPAPVNLEPRKETWPIKVRLIHKPTRDAKNQPTSELSFREPTGKDINECGNPVRLDNNFEAIIDERKMSLMMSQLAGIHHPFIEALDPRDWNSCAYRLRGFFVPSMEGWV